MIPITIPRVLAARVLKDSLENALVVCREEKAISPGDRNAGNDPR